MGADRSRWRCLQVGCNPKLYAYNAPQHKDQTGHRVAAWPVRSAEGEAKQRKRSRASWYDRDRINQEVANGGEWGDRS